MIDINTTGVTTASLAVAGVFFAITVLMVVVMTVFLLVEAFRVEVVTLKEEPDEVRRRVDVPRPSYGGLLPLPGWFLLTNNSVTSRRRKAGWRWKL